MAITTALCTSFKKELLEAEHDFTADTFKLALFTNSASLDATTTAYSTTNEVTGTGYTAGGNALNTYVTTQDNTNNRATWDAADTSWTSATITARGAVLYRARGGAATADELICALDFGSDQTSTNGTFSIVWDANGIIALT